MFGLVNHIQQGILVCESSHQNWRAGLLSPSIFQGTGAKLKILFLFCANMSVRNARASIRQKKGQQLLSHRKNMPPFQLWAQHGCPWDQGGMPLAQFCLQVDFSPRWTQETLACHLLENHSVQITCAFYRFIKLIQALVAFYIYSWAPMPFLNFSFNILTVNVFLTENLYIPLFFLNMKEKN